jgi:hypothetical protein
VTERHYAFLKVDHLQRAIGEKRIEQPDELAEYLAEAVSRIRAAHPRTFEISKNLPRLAEYRLLGSNQGPLDPQSKP